MILTKWADLVGLTISEVKGTDNKDSADDGVCEERIFFHFTNGDTACIEGFGDSYSNVDVRLKNPESK